LYGYYGTASAYYDYYYVNYYSYYAAVYLNAASYYAGLDYKTYGTNDGSEAYTYLADAWYYSYYLVYKNSSGAYDGYLSTAVTYAAWGYLFAYDNWKYESKSNNAYLSYLYGYYGYLYANAALAE
jgi:hypothetical protein